MFTGTSSSAIYRRAIHNMGWWCFHIYHFYHFIYFYLLSKKKKTTNKSPILLLFLQHVECCVQYTTTYIHPPHVYSHQFKLLDCVCYYCICSCLHCLSLTVRNFICRPIVDSVIHNRFVSRTLCCVHYYGCIVVFLFAMRDIAYVTHSWTRHTHTTYALLCFKTIDFCISSFDV